MIDIILILSPFCASNEISITMEFLDNFDRIFGALVTTEEVIENEESDDDDYEEINLEIGRRQGYRQFPRIDFIDMWNEDEFFSRFRMCKTTVVYVLSLIEDKLRVAPNRYVNIFRVWFFFR